jgi:hypothetical protein
MGSNFDLYLTADPHGQTQTTNMKLRNFRQDLQDYQDILFGIAKS